MSSAAVSPAVVDQIKQVESSGDNNSLNADSSAAGLFGFTDGTWVEQAREALPEAEGLSRDEVLALRDDPETQEKVMSHFTEGNAKTLADNDFEASPANVYTVHFAGRSGGIAVLQADEGTALSDVLSEGAMRANRKVKNADGKKFADWSIAEFRAWTREKMGE